MNEITGVSNAVGAEWALPDYDAAGNMTIMPKPGAIGLSYAATYDAWNRLMSLSAGGSQIAGYLYDGLKRRTLKSLYRIGVLSSTRNFFYSSAWQVLENRLGSSLDAERQFIWGLRYIGDVLLRDRDPAGGGTLDERLYGLQDPNRNLTAIADTFGAVQERYAYDAYGMPIVLTPEFGLMAVTGYDWEMRYGGYRWDSESGLYQLLNRAYHPVIGCWSQRDPLGRDSGDENAYRYILSMPTQGVDSDGEVIVLAIVIVGVVVLATAWHLNQPPSGINFPPPGQCSNG